MNKKDKTSTNPLTQRSAGILLHPTSLPGPHGIGDLGPESRRFIKVLANAAQSWWQMLPLNPPSDGASPYQCISAFAGNTLVISPDDLISEGLLHHHDIPPLKCNPHRVYFKRADRHKQKLLNLAYDRFRAGAATHLQPHFEAFQLAESHWLNDFALFTLLRTTHRAEHWYNWPRELILRKPSALHKAAEDFPEEIEREKFHQFLFFHQLANLRKFARKHKIKIIGDIPIFVSIDSADVWTHPHLFRLDRHFHPTVVAGVPPDAFSEDGQRWGNPLYNWKSMKRTGYKWWIDRIRASMLLADIVRIDHFRGFAGYWEVPVAAHSAKHGRWRRAPGQDFFSHLQKSLPRLPFIAEDLGYITPDVHQLRDNFHLPGMRILHNAFDNNPRNIDLPFNHIPNSVAYTGTHDNNTTVGWYKKIPDSAKSEFHMLAPDASRNPAHALLRLAWSSIANLAIAPLQDILALPASARMNLPGTSTGNWTWRWHPQKSDKKNLAYLRDLTIGCGRAQPA